MPDIAYRFEPPGPLGFGGAPLGNMFEAVSDIRAGDTVLAAWDNGIRYFDTAPFYGMGLSEHRFGHVLRNFDRESFVLSTKVGRLLKPAEKPEDSIFVHALPFRPIFDYTADGARRSVEDSLQRLGLSSIDIVYIHDIAEDMHGAEWERLFKIAMEGAAVALTRLRQERVIRAWGLGVNRIEPCLRAMDEADPDIFLLAGRYSLLDQAALKRFLPACEERGLRAVIGGPFNSGLLAGGKTFEYSRAPAEMIAKRDRIAAVCRRHNTDIRAAALQFCAAPAAVAAVIPGAKTPEKAAQNVDLMRQKIPADFWKELKAEGLLPQEAPVPA